MSRKVIITCAVTGAIHTPSMSPHLPVTAKEIADAALGAAKAGAAIVHLHARNPVDGSPSQDPELFTPFLKEIKEKSNVVINLTTGGAPTMTIADRLRPAHHFKPEVASLNMGSMNFGLYDMLKRFKPLSMTGKCLISPTVMTACLKTPSKILHTSCSPAAITKRDSRSSAMTLGISTPQRTLLTAA